MTTSLKWESTADTNSHQSPDIEESKKQRMSDQTALRHWQEYELSACDICCHAQVLVLSHYLSTLPHIQRNHVPHLSIQEHSIPPLPIMRMSLRYTEHSPQLHIINMIFIKLSFFHELITDSLPASSVSPWECRVTINTLLCLIFKTGANKMIQAQNLCLKKATWSANEF